MPGGAVRFAARVVEAFGATAALAVLTVPGGDETGLEGHDHVYVDGAVPLVFAHDIESGPAGGSAAGGRSLRVVSRPTRTLDASVVPPVWRKPALLVLAPLLSDDMDLESFAVVEPSSERLLLAQGLLREVTESGDVHSSVRPPSALVALSTPDTTVALSEEETVGWPAAALDELAERNRRLIVTRGAAGAEVITRERRFHVQPVAARVIDTTGAGDVFATAFACALALGVADDEQEAGVLAAAAAAASIERAGPAPLPSLAALRRRTAGGGAGGDAGAVA